MTNQFSGLAQYMPGIGLYEKSINSVYQAGNNIITDMFGLKKQEQIYGLLDYNIPSPMSKKAEIFRENDKLIIQYKKTMRFFEILDCADRGIAMFLTTKTPKFDHEKNIIGLNGSTIDLTDLLMNVGKTLMKFESKNIHGASQCCYTIGEKPDFDLTLRQSECLFFILRGKSSKEIAKALKLSPRTVESHVESLKNKFNCHTRNELIDCGMNHGFFYVIPQRLFSQQLSVLF